MINFLAHLSRMAHPFSLSLSLWHSFSPPSPHHLNVDVIICFSLVLLLLLTLSPLTNALPPSTTSATAYIPAPSSSSCVLSPQYSFIGCSSFFHVLPLLLLLLLLQPFIPLLLLPAPHGAPPTSHLSYFSFGSCFCPSSSPIHSPSPSTPVPVPVPSTPFLFPLFLFLFLPLSISLSLYPDALFLQCYLSYWKRLISGNTYYILTVFRTATSVVFRWTVTNESIHLIHAWSTI